MIINVLKIVQPLIKFIFEDECVFKCPEKYNYIINGECKMDHVKLGNFMILLIKTV